MHKKTKMSIIHPSTHPSVIRHPSINDEDLSAAFPIFCFISNIFQHSMFNFIKRSMLRYLFTFLQNTFHFQISHSLINYFSLSDSFLLSIVSVCPVNSNMASSTSSRELFKDGVRAVLHSWPVLQVNTSTNGAPGGQVIGERTRWKAVNDSVDAVLLTWC